MALIDKLASIYGSREAQRLLEAIDRRLGSIAGPGREGADRSTLAAGAISQRDAALICYGDSLVSSDGSANPLRSLKALLESDPVRGMFSVVHILPFYPWDTDRGFSVIDYRQVDPKLGGWDDIGRLAGLARLMFDLVMNHASFRNPLVQGGLIARHLPEDHPRYGTYAPLRGLVLAYDVQDAPGDDDLCDVVRPRPNKLLTPYVVFEASDTTLGAVLGTPEHVADGARVLGSGLVWTTFSRPPDAEGRETTCQVDLSFRDSATFLEMLDICLFYAEHGGTLLRLDAVAYVWKKLGSTCIHEPETHTLLSALGDVLAVAFPQLLTVGEINEVQDQAFTYLGEECHLVYQFAHFPLAVYGVRTGDAGPYARWLATQEEAGGRQFLTVLGSHDGMGLKPVRDRFLNDQQIDGLVADLEAHGGRSNFGILPGGRRIVYEVCGTAWSLVNEGLAGDEQTRMARFLAVVSLGMIPRGLPAFYINGLLATDNYDPPEGLDEHRTLNREILDLHRVLASLLSQGGRMQQAAAGIAHMLAVRADCAAFSPWGPEPSVLDLGNHVIGARVQASDASEDPVTVLVNLSDAPQPVGLIWETDAEAKDLLTGRSLASGEGGSLALRLAAYETVWLS
jgi:sucrose phosphorylase